MKSKLLAVFILFMPFHLVAGTAVQEFRQGLQNLDQKLDEALDRAGENSVEARQIAREMVALDGNVFHSPLEEEGLARMLDEALSLSASSARRKALTRIADLNAVSPVPYFLIGQSFQKEGKLHDAAVYFERALDVRPTCAPCHEELGQILIQQGRTEEGKKHRMKAKLFDTGGES